MILITGGTGLVGRHVIAACRTAGKSVVALARTDRAVQELLQLGAVPVRGRVEDPAVWDQMGGISAIIHSAAVIAGPGEWSQYERVNVDGTRLAARRALQLGIPLIHISSVAVYAERADMAPPGSITEHSPFGSRTSGQPYARSKRLAEDAVWSAAAAGLKAVALRPCVVYGPGDRLFLPALASPAARHGFLPVIGRGDQPLALVHASSVAEASVAALGHREAWGQAYNITNDDSITWRECVAAIGEGVNRRVRTVSIPTPLAGGVASVVDGIRGLLGPAFPSFRSAVRFLEGGNPYSSALARARLDWRPTVRHRTALAEAVRDSRMQRGAA